MENIKRRYDRFFIMFKQELSGYSIDGREPNGNCKIEIRDGKGRATTYMQGLKPLKDGSMYRAYLMAVQGDKTLGVPIGWLDIDNRGHGECKWEFNPDNLDGTGLAIEDFTIGAILIKGDNIKELIAPIVGYKDKEILWKNGFKDFSNYNAKLEENKEVNREVKKQPETIVKVDNPKVNLNQQVVTAPQPIHIEPEKDSLDNLDLLEKEKSSLNNSIKEDSNPHQIFNDMVTKFYAEMEELEKYKILNSEDRKMLDLDLNSEDSKILNSGDIEDKLEKKEINNELKRENINNELKRENIDNELKIENIDDITYIFNNNEVVIPFERPNKAIQWIKIEPFELITLNLSISYIKHQFINAGWKKYKHLTLGRYSQNNIYKYILGVPDIYNDKYKSIASDLGFKKFVCYNGRVPQKGNLGYWLMEL